MRFIVSAYLLFWKHFYGLAGVFFSKLLSLSNTFFLTCVIFIYIILCNSTANILHTLIAFLQILFYITKCIFNKVFFIANKISSKSFQACCAFPQLLVKNNYNYLLFFYCTFIVQCTPLTTLAADWAVPNQHCLSILKYSFIFI
jgi:hypothetical protein